MSLIRSLHALPPRQVLALALAERSRRQKIKRTRVALTDEELFGADGQPNSPVFNDTTSLVLDQTHPLSDLYYKKARYKIYWGGRGSAKSWGFAEALVRLAAAQPLVILCCREFQSSIKDSSHRVIKATIERLGLQGWFDVTDNSIRSRVGAEFIFKGLFNNENGIKSTEGIDIAWVEEAHSVSRTSWRSLIPTVRKEGSEIWMSFNMGTEDDATYKMFVETPRPRSIIHKINYDQNPFFKDSELYEEMEHDKATDFQLYEHIWLGMPMVISNEVIFAGKYTIEAFDDDLWKKADRLFFGADFGYSTDPNALIRSFILTEQVPNGRGGFRTVSDLYVEYEAYGRCDIDEMDEFYRSVPGSKDWPIKSDSARPEFPSYFRARGYNMSAAEKWPGSVEDGIAHLRGFRKIIIHPRCVNMAREARLYRYKVDKKQLDENNQPLVLPIIVDANNHGWDAIRYSLDGYIMRSGEVGIWQRLGADSLEAA